MPKKAVSLTLDQDNLIWLKGRARVIAGGSLSEAVDQLIDEARAGRLGASEPSRSVVGTIDLPDDGLLLKGAEEIIGLFQTSLSRPFVLHEERPVFGASKRIRKK
ncbi:MAG TPA: hypothetical protein VD833_26140 [Vicinamibacterales bacterium]|nr:hypothetical protein [Vicinamibacterales bacterium]